MKRTLWFAVWVTALCFFPFAAFAGELPDAQKAGEHPKIVLKDVQGREISLDSTTPYSPKQTCGACHDYDKITNAYHFQMGRTDRDGRIVAADEFDTRTPWVLSSGMYGKW